MNNLTFVWCLFGDEHADYGARCAQTLEHRYPDARYVFYVDRFYDALGERGYIQVPAAHAFRHPFMVTNVLCQLEWILESDSTPGHYTLFLDTDVLHSKELDIRALDRLDADIYPTYRRDMGKLGELQPFNYGVLIVRHTTAVKHAMNWMLQRVLKLHPRHQEWYGNQIALRELCGPVNTTGKPYERPMGYFDLKVAQLPCEQWNWSPHTKRITDARGWGASKHFIHLKGSRKKHFDWYYDKVMTRAVEPQ